MCKILLVCICCAFLGLDNILCNMHCTYIKIFFSISWKKMVHCFKSILLFLNILIFVKQKLHVTRYTVVITPHAKS